MVNRRRRATLTISAWFVGWAFIAAAATGLARAAWPALPIWVLPLAFAGGLLIHEALEVKRITRQARKAVEDDEVGD